MNRNAIDNKIYKNLKNLFNYYNTNKQEIGYQGHYEKLLCENFIKFLGIKGYCDAVNSGTSALYLACSSLIKNKSDELIISPCTNFGTLSAAIFSKYKKISELVIGMKFNFSSEINISGLFCFIFFLLIFILL